MRRKAFRLANNT
jgi:hypothetical protein